MMLFLACLNSHFLERAIATEIPCSIKLHGLQSDCHRWMVDNGFRAFEDAAI